ncbi:MAG: DUF2688 domain-containing protein [Aeriscardovia sp.]|nr:DUF2688 domain-containing protein [Aeriscardovia sp.]
MYKNLLRSTKCKSCGKELTTLINPIFSSKETMQKYQGICSACMSNQEHHEMMLAMNADIEAKIKT